MSANEKLNDKQANTGISYDSCRQQAHQERAEFLAETFCALRRRLSGALVSQIDRMKVLSFSKTRA